MIRLFLIIIILISDPVISTANRMDSLSKLLPSFERDKKIELLQEIGQQYYEQKEYDKSVNTFHQALLISEGSENIALRLDLYKGLVRSAFYNDLEQSLEFAIKMEKLAESHQQYEPLAFAYSFIAKIKRIAMQDTPAARTYLLKSISMYEKAGSRKYLPMVYNELGITYLKDQNYEEAIRQYEQGLAIAKQVQNFEDIRYLKNDLASIYIDLEQYDTALRYSIDALDISTEEERNDLIAFDNLLVGRIYFLQGNAKEGLRYAKRGFEIAEKIGDSDRLQGAYELLLSIYKTQGDHENALSIAEKTMSIKDSLNQANVISNLADKESEISLLLSYQDSLEVEKNAQHKTFVRNGVLISAFSLLFFFFLLYKRNRLLVKLQQRELDHLNFVKKIQEEEKKKMEEKISQNARELASKSMHIIQKNEALTDIKISIADLEAGRNQPKIQSKINKLNRAIDNKINIDEEWEKFKMHFEEVHPQFFLSLKMYYPNLNTNDTRFCAYIKMGLSTKEMAQLFGINPTSIQKARYRLKKKMELEKATDLIEFISKEI